MHKLSLHENSPTAPDKLERLLKVKQRQEGRGSNAHRRHTKVGWLQKRLKC